MTTESQRFNDNGDGTITDSETGLTWTKEDSWQFEKQWVSWDEAEKYIAKLCYIAFAETQDWRLPTRTEISSIFEQDKSNKDKYGKEIHLDPVFPEGSLAKHWTYDYTGNDAYIMDFGTGEVSQLYKSKAGRMAARAVRNASEKTSVKKKENLAADERFRTSTKY